MKPSSFLAGTLCLFALCSPLSAAEKPYQTLYKQGVAANKKGDLDEAIRLYTKAIATKTDSADLYFVRGRALRQKDQYDAAIKDFDKAVALRPNFAEAYNHRGVTRVGKGEQDKAKIDFKKACELGSSDGCANLKRAEGRK
jgi:tetratricopeptide (TPR) repeat protein